MMLDLSIPACDRIRTMSGMEDAEWVKMALAVYLQLLIENPDNIVRFVRENGQTASIGLTHEAQRQLDRK